LELLEFNFDHMVLYEPVLGRNRYIEVLGNVSFNGRAFKAGRKKPVIRDCSLRYPAAIPASELRTYLSRELL
jgi:hypothetical protein